MTGFAGFEINGASAADMALIRDWADEEGWNPGESDRFAFGAADPGGFLVGRLRGEPVACISAVRYGAGFGFIGFYIARPAVRGQGYGIRLWKAGMERLDGRLVGLDGVVEQQDNYRKSGFRPAWNNVRHEGAPRCAEPGGVTVPGVEIVDAATLPFGQLAAYDRRFFPEPRSPRSGRAGSRGSASSGRAAAPPGSARSTPPPRPSPRPCCSGSRSGPPTAMSPWTSRTPIREPPPCWADWA